jgi:chromosomal replication initiation ATPase DnaA
MARPKRHKAAMICGQVDAIGKIIAEVAHARGLTPTMITGRQGSRIVVAARHLAFWRAARETGATLIVLGRVFGNRDHSTILNGIRMHEKRMAAPPPKPAPKPLISIPTRVPLRAFR